jgi:hypothetical protein
LGEKIKIINTYSDKIQKRNYLQLGGIYISISSHQFQLQISPTGIYNFTPRKSDTNGTEIFPEKREEKED